jgi:hypothetical protein
MNEPVTQSPSKSFYVIAGTALVWNLIGLMMYIAQVSAGPAALAELPDAERALYENIPLWATSAFAIAVNAGVVASILLILRRSLAVPVFVVSLVAVFVQMFHYFVLTDALAVLGPVSLVGPALVITIGAFLIWYARDARRKGWLY